MIGKKILILSLLAVSIALASEPLRWITFSQGPEWSVRIEADGSAEIFYGSSDKVEAPPGSFDLKKIEAEIGPLVTTIPSVKKGVNVFNSRMSGQVITNSSYTENIDYVKELVKEVFEKSRVMRETAERFDKWLVKDPPLGLELYFDEDQILRREDYSGPPLRLRKPPPWFTRVVKRYPVLGEYPVVSELFSTPWPYLAMLALLTLVLRRYRLMRRKKLANS